MAVVTYVSRSDSLKEGRLHAYAVRERQKVCCQLPFARFYSSHRRLFPGEYCERGDSLTFLIFNDS